MFLLYLALCAFGVFPMYLPTRIYLGSRAKWLPVGAVGFAVVLGAIFTLGWREPWWMTIVGVVVAAVVHYMAISTAKKYYPNEAL